VKHGVEDIDQVNLLNKGVDFWNDVVLQIGPIDLAHADLNGRDLSRIDFGVANLRSTNLRGTNLSNAKLKFANLTEADLTGAALMNADLERTVWIRAKLNRANLRRADFEGANLTETDLTDARLAWTKFGHAYFSKTLLYNVNLKTARGLDRCAYGEASEIDLKTLERSAPLPLQFLLGIGTSPGLLKEFPHLYVDDLRRIS
jgi:uncharacterized protein YjbI with pentapeptide repeats